MRVAVTGAAGFIGRRLVDALLARGHDVVAIDLRPLDRSQDGRTPAQFSCGDVRDTDALARALRGVEVVLHHAALTSNAASFADVRATVSVNVAGTASVMSAAGRAEVRRVLLASSAAVYGRGLRLPLQETDQLAPLSPYGASKVAAELVLHREGARRGIETVALRYFNVFGPGQLAPKCGTAVLPTWITRALSGAAPVIYGDGSATRDFTFIDDVVRANLLTMSAALPTGIAINIGSGEERSLLTVLSELAVCVGHPLQPVFQPGRRGDAPRSVADLSLARQLLGYQVDTVFEAALTETVAWNARRLTSRRPARRTVLPAMRGGRAGVLVRMSDAPGVGFDLVARPDPRPTSSDPPGRG